MMIKNQAEDIYQQKQVSSTKEKVSERLSQIQSAMENISSSEEFKKYLSVMGKFHDYSLNNTILITLQNPNATHVAGYNQWQERFERHVKKEEKGIEILAPVAGRRHTIRKNMLEEKQLESFLKGEPITISFTDKKTKKERSFTTALSYFKKEDLPRFMDGEPIKEVEGYTYFRPVKVFDVSQTEGKELPKSPIQVNELKGEVNNFDSIMSAIQKISPCKIEFLKEEADPNLKKGAKGYYSRAEERIVIKEGMSQLQTLKTTIHETAHAMLHNEKTLNKTPFELRPDRRDKEIQAESVACAACYYFGLDTSEYSFGYVAGWASADVDKFKASMHLIRETSSEIITAIDKELYPQKYQQKEKEQEQNKEKRKEYIQNKVKSKEKSWVPKQKKQEQNKEHAMSLEI
jgi:hypothetical protein